MINTTHIELAALLPPESLERLQKEARYHHLQLSELVREVIEMYLEELDEPECEEMPEEQIRSNARQAWQEAMIGQTRLAREVIEEIRQELTRHDDNCGHWRNI